MKGIAAAVLLGFLLILSSMPTPSGAASCSPPANPFVLTSVVWGTPSNPIQVQPGDLGVPLTATFLYTGCTSVLYASFSFESLPQGFTPANPQAGSTVYLQDVAPDSSSNVPFNFNLAPSPSLNVGDAFSSTLSITYTMDGGSYNTVTEQVTKQVLGAASLTFSASPLALVAGQVNDITFTMTNNGTGPARNIFTTLTPSLTASVLGMIPEVGELSAAASYSRTVSLYVPATSAGAAVSLAVSATYVDPYSDSRTATQTVGLYSPSSAESVNLAIVPSTDSLTAGEVTDVNFALDNAGSGAASNLTVTATPSQLLSILNVPPKITSLAPGSSDNFTLQIYAGSSAAGSPLSFTFTVTYQDPYGVQRVYTQSVGFYSPSVTQQKGSPLLITVRPDVVIAGQTNNVTVTFSNVGSSPVESLTASFGSPSGSFTWISPSQAQAGEVMPGQNFTVSGSLFEPSSAPASATLQVSVDYYVGTAPTQQTVSLGLLSRGAIDLSLTGLTILPQAVTPGSIVSVTLTLTNLGVTSASGVTASFAFPQGFSAVGSSTTFIGAMQADSPTTITISAIVSNSTAPGSYTVPVTLGYTDNLHEQQTQRLNFTVGVANAQPVTTPVRAARGTGVIELTLEIAAVVVVIVLAVLLVRRLRKPKPA